MRYGGVEGTFGGTGQRWFGPLNVLGNITATGSMTAAGALSAFGVVTSPGTLDATTVNVIHGPATNTIAGGDANTISGGGNAANINRMTGATSYRTIAGGYDNLIGDAIASTISGGAHQQILNPTTHGTIGGGSFNLIDTAGNYSVIAGGSTNHINATQATISGGVNNQAGDTCSVGGGSTNIALGQYSSIGGGITHTITVTSSAATIAGGNTHTITNSNYASICGGYTHLIGTASLNCLGATIGGGYQNAIGQSQQAQYTVIAGGRVNSINADYGHITGGFSNSVTGAGGCAGGFQAKSYLRGQNARSGGQFAAAGDAQISDLHAFISTTNATATAMAVDGVSGTIALPNATTWGFNVTVIAKRTDVVGEEAMYTFSGLIKRDANAASTTLRAGGTPTVVYETTAAWDCAITADTVNGALKITVTGEAAKTIRWSARLLLTEVAS